MTLTVSEVFGPTVQGEGPAAGRRAVFVRLGICNLSCSWCDTPYTWDRSRFDLGAELASAEPGEVLGEVLKAGAGLVVITGGEPMLQRRELAGLVTALRQCGRLVHVETNGTIPPGPLGGLVDLFTVSPKLPNAGLDQRKAVNARALACYADLAARGRAVLKFVCCGPGDVALARDLAVAHGFAPSQCWVMPEATTAGQVTAGLQALAGPAVRAGMNVTGRLHVSAWGNERGR